MAAPRSSADGRHDHFTLGRRSFLGLGAAGLAATTLGISGCGGNSGRSGDSDTFTFMTWGATHEREGVVKVVDKICGEAGLSPDVQVVAYDAYATKINTLIAANTPPDAGYLNEGTSMQLGVQGKIKSIAGRPEFENWIPPAVHYWDDENAVGVIALETCIAMYNKDITDGAGLTVPSSIDAAWKWDDFIAAADKITKDHEGRSPSESGFDPDNVAQYAVSAPGDLPTLHGFFVSNGIQLFNEEGTECYIDSPEAIEVVQSLVDLVFKHRVSPTPVEANSFGGNPAALLGSGRVAMIMAGQWNLVELADMDLNYDVGVLPIFQQPAMSFFGGAAAVFEDGKHPDEGFAVLSALGDPLQTDLYTTGIFMPQELKYYTDEAEIAKWIDNPAHPPGYRTSVVDPVLEYATPYFSFKLKDFPLIESTLGGGIEALFDEPTDVPAALKKLAADVAPLMKGSYPDVLAS
jgi:multiple sugar transport system substrate-binding protein